MKKYLVLFVIFSFSLFAQIHELKNIKDLNQYISKDTLVIFDLDNVIMEPVQQYGSDQWFFNNMQNLIAEGKTNKEALRQTLEEWFEVQAVTKVRPVEKTTKKVIDNLQKKNVLVMGLTIRSLDLSFCAIKQLNSININLFRTSPFKKDILLNEIIYRKGILFAGGIDKGEVLSNFFEYINFHSKRIVFIDDKLKNVQALEKFCDKNNIEYIGLRYSYLDDKVNSFNPKIAKIQSEKFGSIISDIEAKKSL